MNLNFTSMGGKKAQIKENVAEVSLLFRLHILCCMLFV
jgi:hypothetical protein